MLPHFLAGSYQRYKEDTTVFTTWLSKTAMTCGYKPGDLTQQESVPPKVLSDSSNGRTTSARLKGRARKEAKAAGQTPKAPVSNSESPRTPIAKYAVTAKDLLRQAEVVAASVKPRVQMPFGVLRVVERAVDARQRCSAWFQKTGVMQDAASTERHLHFIDVLQSALGILKPCCETSTPNRQAQTQDAKSTSSTSAVLGVPRDSLSNRFQALGVEDVEDVLDITVADCGAMKAKQSSKKESACEVFELDLNNEIDSTFDVFCFFEDLHRIQDFLKETWKSYKAGKVDLLTATATTNAAIRLVSQAEEDIIATKPQAFSKPKSYKAIAAVIFYVESLRRGEDSVAGSGYPSVEALKITPFDEFLYLPTARILMKFERIASFKVAYPQPIPPIKMSYLALPELLQTPEIQRWDKEDEFLSQHLMDQWFFEDIRKAIAQTRGMEPPVMDELSQGFRKLSREGEVSTWIVFGSRVLLDIQEILGDEIVRSHKETRAAAKDVTNVLGFKTLDDGRLAPFQGLGERWKTPDAGQVTKLDDLARIWIVENLMGRTRDMWMEKSGGLATDGFLSMDELDPEMRKHVEAQMRAKYKDYDEGPSPEVVAKIKAYGPLKAIQPNKDSDFIHTHNPLYCGTLAFQLAIDREQAGISLANHHTSIFAVAHLYNALRQLDVLEERWMDMEKIIDLHIKFLFAGQLPTTPKDFHSRCCLQLGVSAQNFARNQRPGHMLRMWGAGKRGGPQIPCTKTTDIFRQYFAGKESADRCLYQLKTLTMDEEGLKSTPSNKSIPRRQLSPLQFLTRLQDWLPQVVSNMNIDYITMTRTCNRLLRRLRAKINDEMDGLYAESRVNEDSNEPMHVIMVMSVLQDAADAEFVKTEVIRDRKQVLPKSWTGPQMELAGKVMDGFLGELEERR
ncbi:MAG: hypothetical protein FRX48_07636 [Lasallia pustulata]|uniref:DUF6604 domain-containing protein n=1 Tax=Lasallia pustulata TaxID=136370 RepID=A0A5M8PID1_9LECA|nr:MAG: hypothetical protein FRX48_07636 [Lasallia pustulata]